ncbi:cohesin domain-containing protein [Silvibacterium acidisoli]|uniref:cohesin domain-containing protein n=1 Tax=Acidobacteriaceae bacterium ZG23-2 TaxID=2883246 RepID=UPI00406C1FF0
MKYSIKNWAALALFGLALGLAPAAHAQSAKKLYKMAQAAEQKDDVETAYQDYSQAFQKDPKEDRYKEGYERTRFAVGALHIQRGQKLRAQGDTTGALTEFLRAIEIDPSNELAQQEIQAMRKKADATAPPPLPETPEYSNSEMVLNGIGEPLHLKPLSKEPLTLHSVEDSKVIYQTVGKLAGINVLFDPDYTSKRIPVDLTNVDLYDALRIIGTISGTFWRPVTDNTIFVAQNSRSKRTELEEQAVQTFYLTNVSQQNDFTDVQTALRNMFQTAKIYGVASQNAIIMRGTPDELLLAQKLINDLDKAKPEVVVDVAVLEVSRNYERTIGIQLPQTVGVSFQESNLNQSSTSTSSSSSTTTGTTDTSGSSTSNGLTLNSLAHLNGTNFAVSIGSATANLLLTDSSTKVLQNPRIRASDGQEATLKIGERLPVATGSYQTGAATAIVSSLVNTQFQYLDIGVNVTIKPTVHYDRDVTLKLKIEVSGSNSNSNIGGIEEPIITQRTVDQTIRLKEGEANILGGILQKQTSLSLSGTPGLAQLPILKYLFGSNDKTTQDDEIVFLLIPHVVRATMLDPLNLRELDTGTGGSIQLRQMNQTDAQAAIQKAQSQGQFAVPPTTSQTTSANGPVTAAAAAAGAIASMQEDSAAVGLPGQPGPVKLQLTPEMGQQKVGSTFQMAVHLDNGNDVFSVPMQLKYDQSKLSLVNVDLGDPQSKSTNLLGQDGQAVALVHRDDGNGTVSISASRPPGTKGVNGSGTVCVLTFQAKAAGDAPVILTRPVVRNSAQQAQPATGSRALVQVRP